MNYSQVERDNIARGNRMAIDILFVLIKILDVRFNSVISIIYIQFLSERSGGTWSKSTNFWHYKERINKSDYPLDLLSWSRSLYKPS